MQEAESLDTLGKRLDVAWILSEAVSNDDIRDEAGVADDIFQIASGLALQFGEALPAFSALVPRERNPHDEAMNVHRGSSRVTRGGVPSHFEPRIVVRPDGVRTLVLNGFSNSPGKITTSTSCGSLSNEPPRKLAGVILLFIERRPGG
jgi:hypothetical protein